MESWERRAQRVRDVATILPIITVLLFMPPLVLVFAAPIAVFDVPLIVVYLYFVWAAVILINFVVVRKLAKAREEPVQHQDEP